LFSACETLFPKRGALPQISHVAAIFFSLVLRLDQGHPQMSRCE